MNFRYPRSLIERGFFLFLLTSTAIADLWVGSILGVVLSDERRYQRFQATGRSSGLRNFKFLGNQIVVCKPSVIVLMSPNFLINYLFYSWKSSVFRASLHYIDSSRYFSYNRLASSF